MKFTLCYKKYDYKMTIGAIKEFEDETGKCLWSTMLNYIYTWQAMRANGDHLMAILSQMGKILTFRESAIFLHVLARQSNSLLKIEEIEDAMFRVGLTGIEEDEKLYPYQWVIFETCLNTQQYLGKLSPKKSPSDS